MNQNQDNKLVKDDVVIEIDDKAEKAKQDQDAEAGVLDKEAFDIKR